MLTLQPPTARQKEVLYLPGSGHHVVVGSAGCGKTTMALHRALHLGSGQFDFTGRTAVITYNRSLANWMNAALANDAARVDVLTSHEWAWKVLEAAGESHDVYLSDRNELRSLRSKALSKLQRQIRPDLIVEDKPPRFLIDELEWLDAMGVASLDEYLERIRTGRGETPLRKPPRRSIWRLRETYHELRAAKGYEFDLSDIATRVLEMPTAGSANPYAHVVIDEGQDLTPQMLRAIAAATPDSGSITYFGDPTQQIYGRLPSWKSAGLKITKEWRFRWNYRNTQEIAAVADEIARGLDDVELGAKPEQSGPRPDRLRFTSRAEEERIVADLATADAQSGKSVAVLSRTHGPSEAVARSVPSSRRKLSRKTTAFEAGTVYYGTVHAAKGLEFDCVYVVGLGVDAWPDPALIDSTDEESAEEQDRKLLYVAVTRARDRLHLSYTGNPTRILPETSHLYA